MVKINYIKREDLNHTGSHKINNVLGQILLAKKMGKKRIIAETGAGQHGVATATAALFSVWNVKYIWVKLMYGKTVSQRLPYGTSGSKGHSGKKVVPVL